MNPVIWSEGQKVGPEGQQYFSQGPIYWEGVNGIQSTRKELTGSKILGRSQMGPNLVFFLLDILFVVVVVVVNLKHLPIAL